MSASKKGISVDEAVELTNKIKDYLLENEDAVQKMRDGRENASEDEMKDKFTQKLFERIEEGDSALKGRFQSADQFRKAWAEVKTDKAVKQATDQLTQAVQKKYGTEGKSAKGKK